MKIEEVYLIDQIINNMNYSITYVGVIVMVLAEVAKLLGLNIGSAELTTTALTVLQFAGAVAAFFGRWRAGGLSVWGFRK